MNRIPSPLNSLVVLLVSAFVVLGLAMTAMFGSWRAGVVIAAFAVALLAAGSMLIDLGRPSEVRIRSTRR